jgi:hypothetical protein
MAEITPGGILERVVKEVPNFFKDGLDQIATGEGEYIRSGEPQGVVGKIGQAVARSYCRQYGADPGAAKFGNAARIENACRPYLDDIDPGNGAAIELPFEGGQCATRYRFRGAGSTTVTNCQGTGPVVVNANTLIVLSNVPGPIASTQLLLTSPTNCGFGSVSLRVVNGAGTAFQAIITSPTFTGNAKLEIGGVGFTLERFDGLPDDCGNPPPVVRQPSPVGDPSPPPFRFNPGPEIDIEVDVDVSPEGDIIIDIGGGPVTVDPFPEAPTDTGPPPGDIGEPGASGDTGAGGDTEGEAGTGEVLVGLRIEVLESPPQANQYVEGVFRGACYVYMGVEDNLDQDYGGSMLKSGQFFFAEKDNLTHWLVSANNGFRFSVTPYYREVQG